MTVAEFACLPDDDTRMELVRGMVVREPPPGAEHGWTGAAVFRVLDAFVRERQLGVVLQETGFELASPPLTVRAPDVAFVAADRMPPFEAGLTWWRLAPDLVVEISTRDTAAVRAKIEDYLIAGTRLAWLVDLPARRVTVFSAGAPPCTLSSDDTLEGGAVLPGLRIRIDTLFR